jgi:hypothetical protein
VHDYAALLRRGVDGLIDDVRARRGVHARALRGRPATPGRGLGQ